ncbi:tetratricopeptide repeat protein [Mycolicibacterium gadium]|uniref:Tetratricopeptide repeat protein n=1 Tax=Mycolicibacterium gadium TaxID=1794 RepID=A0ABT6GUN3_MYCGU|nr:tetratricopeptide repeat protein [Mycolicibacterium gadium]MDG5484932.1 tetratricopeptide repeat protein [Mycolicibacterium gadium]
MADDADAPEGELTKSAASEEKSGAAEPESAAEEESTASSGDKASMGDAADPPDVDAVEPVDEDAASYDEEAAAASDVKAPKAPMSPVRLATIAGLVVVILLAGLAGWTGYRGYQAYQGEKARQLFLQVGRQGALNLTTIDWQNAEADVQRVLDSATGTFYDDFQNRSAPFVQVVKQAQSKSVGTIAEAGLESATDNEAQVLVAVTVTTSNVGAPEQEPRAWRMRLTVQKVGDDAKVSNVEFVP